MNYEVFLDRTAEELTSYLSYHHGPVEIRKVDVEKLGSPSYRGLAIGKEGAAISFTFDPTSFYERLEAGQNYYHVMSDLAAVADRHLNEMPHIDTAMLNSYENIRAHLTMQLVGTQANQAMLRNVPHTEIEDMSVVYRVKIDMGRGEEASTLVTNRMLSAFGITKEQLHADALESAPSVSPATLRVLSDVLGEMIGDMEYTESPPNVPQLYVASTRDSHYGAASVFYPGFLEAAKQVVGDQFFVLPSSLHEMLLYPDNGMMSTAELKAMVTAINADVVQPEEVLTNNVYHYDGDERIFEQADAYDARQASGLDEKKPSLLKNLKDLEKECEEKPAPEPRFSKDEMSL